MFFGETKKQKKPLFALVPPEISTTGMTGLGPEVEGKNNTPGLLVAGDRNPITRAITTATHDLHSPKAGSRDRKLIPGTPVLE